MADREQRTIAHRLFWYVDEKGRHRYASRGETVSLNADDLERGDKSGAFGGDTTDESAELVEFPDAGSPEEQAAWVGSATVNDIAAYVADHPEHANAILAAEHDSRGENARKGVEAAVAAAAGQSPV